ncbi:MAG TPA: hypothetical protein VF622_10900 [Segetibacter sp.]
MRIIYLFLFVVTSKFCIAQNGDFPDYRSKKELFTRIQEKDIRSDVASYSMAGIDESVGKLPLKTIPISKAGSNFISFEENNIQVNITGGTFDPSKHKLGYFDTEKKHLVKINNKPYFGDYGKVPKTTIENISVIIDRDTIVIPQTAFFDLYNPIFSFKEGGVIKSNNKVYLSADGRKIYIYMLKQEAGGSYEATWVIQDRKYLRRVVDFGFLR